MATLTVTADEDYRDGSPSLFLADQIVFATYRGRTRAVQFD